MQRFDLRGRSGGGAQVDAPSGHDPHLPRSRPDGIVRIAVVGVGYWGPNLVRVFVQHAKVESVVVCDLDRSRLDRMRVLYPTIETRERMDDVLDDPSIDGVVLALPAALHHEATRRALRAGKDVLVEKPLAMTVPEGRELCSLARDRGRVLMVGHTFLFNAAVRKVKQYVDSGELGTIYYIYAQRLNLGIVRRDVDVLWNLAPHDVSIVLHWLGDRLPVEVTCQGSSYLQRELDDVSFLMMRFADEILAHVHVSWLDPSKVRRMTVVGSSKMAVYDDTSAEARVQLFDKGIDRQHIDRNMGRFEDFAEFQLVQRAGDLLIPRVAFAEPLKEEADHFVSCIASRSTPITDGENGLRVLQVLEAATRSRREQGRPVRLDG
jgi:predicted dehydrogenase